MVSTRAVVCGTSVVIMQPRARAKFYLGAGSIPLRPALLQAFLDPHLAKVHIYSVSATAHVKPHGLNASPLDAETCQ